MVLLLCHVAGNDDDADDGAIVVADASLRTTQQRLLYPRDQEDVDHIMT
eukprot:CAMPEP_0119557394 /NCGR_PEP_ID=MMETSP1352-20130426/9077_1 /TAXON_ID=265584 /ORGANISM="Stauroneis constricta, Strain CCMP1120" /LENGTH=48 /DNA_ID= /DNA_START= /DNA_END= /DNA_ORIENTATION=